MSTTQSLRTNNLQVCLLYSLVVIFFLFFAVIFSVAKLGLLGQWVILAFASYLHRVLDLLLGDAGEHLVTLPLLLCFHYYDVLLGLHVVVYIIQLLFYFFFVEHYRLLHAETSVAKHVQELLRVLSEVFRLEVAVTGASHSRVN